MGQLSFVSTLGYSSTFAFVKTQNYADWESYQRITVWVRKALHSLHWQNQENSVNFETLLQILKKKTFFSEQYNVNTMKIQ